MWTVMKRQQNDGAVNVMKVTVTVKGQCVCMYGASMYGMIVIQYSMPNAKDISNLWFFRLPFEVYNLTRQMIQRSFLHLILQISQFNACRKDGSDC